MKKILGLDLGTNSIGWALIENDFANKEGRIINMGSRIIPMGQDKINDFNKGTSISNTAERTQKRGARRLRERQLQRRSRLVRVLKSLKWISDSYNPETDKIAYDSENNFKFQGRYESMRKIFEEHYPDLKAIPKDWTIYYLRKLALTEKIDSEELAWVIMQFNTKRGYYELRSDEEEKEKPKNKTEEYVSERVIEVRESDTKGIYEVKLENGITALTSKQKEEPAWLDQKIDFILTTTVLKDGSERKVLRAPDENDWTLKKKSTEDLLSKNNPNVGAFIFDLLLSDPTVKIRGKAVQTIERKFYKDELIKILKVQESFHSELQDKDLYHNIISDLYKSNQPHKNKLSNQNLSKLIINDIIFYQRPLKSKKHLIDGCKYEKRYFLKDGEREEIKVKACPKSHPDFLEFRIWSYIHNFRIIKKEMRDDKGKIKTDVDVTGEFINESIKEKLFEQFWLNASMSVKKILKIAGVNPDVYRLNYDVETKFPGNPTAALFLKAFKKSQQEKEGLEFLADRDKLNQLWHIIYSLEKKDYVKKALENPKFGFPQDSIAEFEKLPAFKNDYGSLSLKAINKLLPVMRTGKYWEKDTVSNTFNEFMKWKASDDFQDQKEKIKKQLELIDDAEDLKELSVTLAEYVVYHYHSEDIAGEYYKSYNDIKPIKQHSLRNPIVEQVLNETLMLVRDVWKEYGRPEEIHVEVARELKNPKDKRVKMNQNRAENERTNNRIKELLNELKNENPQINPFSIGHIEMLKLYEEGALNGPIKPVDEDILKISRKDNLNQEEINKYKHWLEQNYRSPYTGKIIPLSDIFTSAYEIEHVIPQSRYFDNSFNNKVISEAQANKLKDKQTAYEFICKHGGAEITVGNGRMVKILEKEEYEILIRQNFWRNRSKMQKLLSYDVPDSFINRQLNDTRYISREIRKLLAPIVRKENEKEANPVDYITVVGAITDKLKEDWGLKSVWKDLMKERFIRMNEITETNNYYWQKENDYVLAGANKGIKRLDHRHHALDALVVAATTREHINYLNSIQEFKKTNFSYARKLKGTNSEGELGKRFLKPWATFTQDTKAKLSGVVASHKNRIHTISKTNNKYLRYKDGKKVIERQKNKDLWSVRKQLHAETVYGKIKLRQYKDNVSLSTALKDWKTIADPEIREKVHELIKKFGKNLKNIRKHLKDNPIEVNGKIINKITTYYYEDFAAVRKSLAPDISIDKVANSQIKKILEKHLENYDGKKDKAFSPAGIADLNSTLEIPIYKVRVYEALGKKFALGEKGDKKNKYVEAAKGTNLHFIIFEHKDTGQRIITSESTLAYKDVIDAVKSGIGLDEIYLNSNSQSNVIQKIKENRSDYRWFSLSPGDLVYVPEGEDCEANKLEIKSVNWENLSPEQIKKIYIMEKTSGTQCYFLPVNISSLVEEYSATNEIKVQGEFGSQNKSERNLTEVMIKDFCVKLKINRLGQLKYVGFND